MVDPANWKCEHYHTGLEHPLCWQRNQPKQIGYLDIEASNLDADFGFVLSWCIKHADQNKYSGYVLTKKDYETTKRDRNAIKTLIPAIAQFDTIVTYYGHDYQFDMPFLRTRALKYGFQFLPYKSIIHIDLYKAVKSKFKLHRNRLETCAEFFGLAEKTKIKSEMWNKATMKYDREALRYIWRHNKIDTIILEQLHKIVAPYITVSRRSI